MSDIIDFESLKDLSKAELAKLLGRQTEHQYRLTIERLNREHAVVNIHGHVGIAYFREDGRTGSQIIDWMTEKDFKVLRGNWKPIKAPDAKRAVPPAIAWLKEPGRRTYAGMAFSPGQEDDAEGILNLWQGYRVKPAAGPNDALDRFLDMLAEVHCDSSCERYTYLLDWLCDMFQNPMEKPGVALMFRGTRGTGKTFAAEMVGEILGPHFFKATQPRHVTHHFNQHLETTQLLFLEEAIWAGDRQAESVMKDLITSSMIVIERKGFPVYQARNHMRIIGCSNEDFMAPAGAEERRYAVYDVAETRKQNGPYFQALRRAMMKEGGLQALLHLFLTRKITQDIRRVPKTQALLDQKTAHLDHFDRWLFEMLAFGELTVVVANGDGRPSRTMVPWDKSVATSALYDDYCQSIRDLNSRAQAINAVHFGRKLRNRLKKAGPVRKAQTGSGTAREWRLTLPPLPACREAFESYLGQPVVWED